MLNKNVSHVNRNKIRQSESAYVYEELQRLHDKIDNQYAKIKAEQVVDFNSVLVAENLTNLDCNDLIGRLIIGYGNNMTNRPPAGNGYFINIPHATSGETYNKQFYFIRGNYDWYVRNMENSVWDSWTKM